MSASKLNKEYFETVTSFEKDTKTYTIVRPLGNPIILFSGDETPLAALHLKSANKKTPALITKRPACLNDNAAGFQGIVGAAQEVEFIISNLTGYRINFNLIKSNSMLLNSHNILTPHESHCVKADSETSCTIVLETTSKKSSGEKVSVGEAETQKTHDKMGSYIYATVIPENVAELVGKFKNTFWGCVDLMCMVEDTPKPVPQWGRSYRPEPFVNRILAARHGRGNQDIAIEPYYEVDEVHEGRFPAPTDHGREGRFPEPTTRQRTTNEGYVLERREVMRREVMENRSERMLERHTESAQMEIDEGDEYDDEEVMEVMESTQTAYRSASSAPKPEGASVKGMLQSAWSALTGAPDVASQSQNMRMINDSKIARITQGTKVVEHVRDVNDIELDCDAQSAVCMLGLSVDENLVIIIPDQTLVVEKAKEMQQCVEANIDQNLLEKLTKIYGDDPTCIFCQCDDTPLDMVLYQCGHLCGHYECAADKIKTKDLTKCPLCRGLIISAIKLRVEVAAPQVVPTTEV